jgi:tripartite-type tricarboxylate transporter receptor subunit TctC
MKALIGKWLVASAAVLPVGAAVAQYPDKPIQVVVPFPPGGSVDPIGRALQGEMQSRLGVPVVIMNQPGAGGTLGTAHVARAPADGYTLGLTTVGPLTTQPHMKQLTYDVDAFEYVCRTHVTPQVLAVPIDSPLRTLEDFVDYARKNRGKVTMSSTGVGSLPHLAAVEFGQLAGFEWVHVPTKGDSEALTLALSGDITGWVAGVQTFSRMSSKLRALGILEDQRSAALPDIPTFREQGYPLLSAGWGGIIAPKDTPRDVVTKLSDACEQAARTPEFLKMLQTMLVPQGYLPAPEFKAFVKSEYSRYGKLIRETGAATEKGR